MRKSTTLVRSFVALLLIGPLAAAGSAQVQESSDYLSKIGPLLRGRAALAVGWSPIIVRGIDATSASLVAPMIKQAGGVVGRSLPIINGQAAYVPNGLLTVLAKNPLVQQVSLDRPVVGAMERTGFTVGATAVRQGLGYDGSGIGVAVIDSGLTSWHDDLRGEGGGLRLEQFVDFVNGRQTLYDDYGHGTHVAGIIAGNGFDSGGARSGIAPAAHLIVLKTLDRTGTGRVSDVIAALDYVVANKGALNIRVVNLSVAAGVYESYNSDPLTLAAKRAVEAGIVVVAAAGNAGRDSRGRTQYGGVMAPGNAPWVLTVGASSHNGTIDRSDDVVAVFSSRGPAAVDHAAKPDLVAPGVGIESLSDPNSALYNTASAYLLSGTVSTPYLPYLSLTGTSMAAPVVSGTVALMLEANPTLTPNAVKAILQYTSQRYSGYDPLTQGAGFLNAKGAVELARFFAAPSSASYPSSSNWGAQLIWGNHLVGGGHLMPAANAWSPDVTWGAALNAEGKNIEWGVICSTSTCDTREKKWAAWGTTCTDATCSTVAWGSGGSQNVVWGLTCGGADCQGTWSIAAAGTAIFGASDGDTVVWGSTDGGDTVVWGSDDGYTVVWGSSCTDPACQPIIWDKNIQ